MAKEIIRNVSDKELDKIAKSVKDKGDKADKATKDMGKRVDDEQKRRKG